MQPVDYPPWCSKNAVVDVIGRAFLNVIERVIQCVIWRVNDFANGWFSVHIVKGVSMMMSLFTYTLIDNCFLCSTSVRVWLLLLLSYHRRLRMILRSARAARGRRSG